MSGVAAYLLYGLRRLRAPRALGAYSVTREMRSQCSKNRAEAPRDTVGIPMPVLRASPGRHRFLGLAHLVRGCCEWYWIVRDCTADEW
eukprot:1149601-Rhodomonas_salina.2